MESQRFSPLILPSQEMKVDVSPQPQQTDPINAIVGIVLMIKTFLSLQERKKPALLGQICGSSFFKNEPLEACSRTFARSLEKYGSLDNDEPLEEPSSFQDKLVLAALDFSDSDAKSICASFDEAYGNCVQRLKDGFFGFIDNSSPENVKNRVKRDDDDDDELELEHTQLVEDRHFGNENLFQGEFDDAKATEAANMRRIAHANNNDVRNPRTNTIVNSDNFDDIKWEWRGSTIYNGRHYPFYQSKDRVDIIQVENYGRKVRKGTAYLRVNTDPYSNNNRIHHISQPYQPQYQGQTFEF